MKVHSARIYILVLIDVEFRSVYVGVHFPFRCIGSDVKILTPDWLQESGFLERHITNSADS